jgi:hypothetical protein
MASKLVRLSDTSIRCLNKVFGDSDSKYSYSTKIMIVCDDLTTLRRQQAEQLKDISNGETKF